MNSNNFSRSENNLEISPTLIVHTLFIVVSLFYSYILSRAVSPSYFKSSFSLSSINRTHSSSPCLVLFLPPWSTKASSTLSSSCGHLTPNPNHAGDHSFNRSGTLVTQTETQLVPAAYYLLRSRSIFPTAFLAMEVPDSRASRGGIIRCFFSLPFSLSLSLKFWVSEKTWGYAVFS